MKQRYDLIFGLGMACSCSQTLRKAKMQHLSFPYDWLTLYGNSKAAYDGDIVRRAKEVAAGFPGWFAKEDFRHERTAAELGKELYCVDRLGLLFIHDFFVGTPFEEAFPAVNAKYRRRINRLIECIRSSRRVLVMRMDRPDFDFTTSVEDCLAARKVLSDGFPGVRFDIFHFAYEKGRAFDARKTETFEDGGYTRVTYDYKDYTPGCLPTQVDMRVAAELLRELVSVRDYRTFGERTRFAWLKLLSALGIR